MMVRATLTPTLVLSRPDRTMAARTAGLERTHHLREAQSTRPRPSCVVGLAARAFFVLTFRRPCSPRSFGRTTSAPRPPRPVFFPEESERILRPSRSAARTAGPVIHHSHGVFMRPAAIFVEPKRRRWEREFASVVTPLHEVPQSIGLRSSIDSAEMCGSAGLLCVDPQTGQHHIRYRSPMKELRGIGIKVKKRRDERQHACLENLAVCADVERRVVSGGSAAELARSIQSHELTSSQLTSVLISRSRVLGLQKLNAVTDELYDGALACARSVDDTAANGEPPQNGQVLLGIPISIKDHIDVNGTDSTAGMLSRCLQPKEKDALVVELLRDAGALIFCKTNVPQSLMLPETDNHIFGRTVNPWDVARTSGGSTGGEAAMIAARASILGIGTDIAGSIRIPSHMCGIYGFRPTPSRVSTRGVATPFLRDRTGQKTIRLACGPMANHVDDLALVLRAWWVPKMWGVDPCVTPKLFDQQVYAHGPHGGKRPIRVGYFTTDNWFQPAAAIVRAVHEAKAALEKAGYQAVEFTPPKDGWQAARLAYGIYGADGNLYNYVRGLEGEPMIPLYKKLLTAANIPNPLRPLLLLTLRLLGEKRLHVLLSVGRSGGLTVREYYELVADSKEFQDAWLHAMDELEVDALLCPGLAVPAWQHGMAVDLDAACSYTFTANILHFPAGAVPITTVQQDEAHYRWEDVPPTQRDSIARAAARALEGSAGLPVGVQVWARPNADELCLHVMKDLERHVGFSSIPEMAKVMMTA